VGGWVNSTVNGEGMGSGVSDKPLSDIQDMRENTPNTKMDENIFFMLYVPFDKQIRFCRQ
jgi:hypothetical protein